MNFPGHIGFGVLTFGVVANILELTTQTSIVNIAIYLAICMFSASKIIDQDLKIAFILPKDMRHKRYLYHRQITHSLILWVGLLYYSIYGIPANLQNLIHNEININYYLFFFAIGGISHLIADMLTGSVPIFLWGKYNRGFRIGLNIEVTKKIFVTLGDKLYIPMMCLGIYLIYSQYNLITIYNHIIK